MAARGKPDVSGIRSRLLVLRRMMIKEVLQLRADKRMLRVLLVAPLIQLTVLGFAANNDVDDIPMVLVDLDRTSHSRSLTDRFLSSGRFELVGQLSAQSEIEPWLRRGTAQLALVIASGYGRAIGRGECPSVQLLVDGTDANSAVVGMGYAASIIADVGARLETVARRPELTPGVGVSGAGPAAGAAPTVGRIEPRPRIWYNPDLASRWYYLPVILALVLMLNTLILPSMGIVREKEIGTFEQILVTPLEPWQMIVGKLLPFAVIGFINVIAITAIIVFGFQVPLRGSFALLLLLTAPFLLTNLSLGLWVSTLVRTQQQAMMTAIFLLMIPMIYLSGLIFPIENMPDPIQWVTYAIPLTYYAIILRGVFLKGSGIEILWPQGLILLIFGTTILLAASTRFRKSLD